MTMRYIRSLGIALFGVSLVAFGVLDAKANRPRTTVAPTDQADFTSSAPAHLPPDHAPSKGGEPGGLVMDDPGALSTKKSPYKGETYPYADSARTSQSGRNTRMASPTPGGH